MFLVQKRINRDGCVDDCEALSQDGKLSVGFSVALNPAYYYPYLNANG